MEQPGDQHPRSRTPWIVAAVVALVCAIPAGAGLLAQQGHPSALGAPLAAPEPTQIVGHHWLSNGASLDPATCVSPSSGDLQVDKLVSGICAQQARGVAAVTPAPRESEPAAPSYGPEPTLAPAKDPVVAKLTAWGDYDAECVLLIHGLTPGEAVRRMGGDPAKHIAADTDVGISHAVTAVGQISGVTVLAEDNGFSCADPGVLRRLTRAGVMATTVYWSVEMDTMLSYAVNGTVLTTWDPVIQEAGGTQPHGLDTLKAQVAPDVDNAHDIPAMLAVAARLTGAVVSYGWKPGYWVLIPNL
ncbi:MAG: hypothetical protein QOF82_1940 [Frankiales bacterium]|nr:hypothetical protein [Frankiales bacterium]